MRFRERETNYVKGLEANVADLQHSVTSVMLEKDSLARENAQLMELLGQKLPNDGSHVSEKNPPPGKSSPTAFDHEHAIVSRKHSSDAGVGRVAVTSADHSSRDTRDAWEAVDFILTLETPCRDHVNLPPHIAARVDHAAADTDGPSNHAMTMTAAVYARTVQLPSYRPDTTNGDVTTYGFVPQFELERYSFS